MYLALDCWNRIDIVTALVLFEKMVQIDYATQRLAISRARLGEADMIEAATLDMPQAAKMGQTECVGCMAVFGRNRFIGR